ncbi:MAG: hypothetical protein DIU55_010110 [Bacillota bacterium]
MTPDAADRTPGGAWPLRDRIADAEPEPLSPDELAGRDCTSVYRALEAERDRLRRMVEAVRDVHRPYPVYELCGHDEDDDECDPIQLDDGTWTCGPLVAVVCSACCIDVRGQQTDECAEDHDHGDGLPLCPTIAALSEAGGER